MSSTGTFGINSDNFNISGNTNINNLVVSGTTSFPSNSISGSAISSSVANATLAATATNALACSGNAATATNATTAANSISCSGNAATATVASNALACSGNAATATQINQNYDNTTTTETYSLLFSPKSASSGNNTVYQGPIFYTPNTNLINANVANATTATTSTNAFITGNNTQSTTFYIPFVSNSNGTGGFPLKTASGLSIVPSTGILTVSGLTSTGSVSCTGLTTTGTITLPTATTPYNATTGTGTNNLGQVISGTIASNVLSTTSATLSTISLNAGVWMIVGSINATIAASNTIQICINTSNTATLNKNISATGYAQSLNVSASVSTILSLTAATATPINLNGNSSVAPTASSTVGQFYAVRIA